MPPFVVSLESIFRVLRPPGKQEDSAAAGAAATGGEASGEGARRSVAGRLAGTHGSNRHEACNVTDEADRPRQRRHFAVLHSDAEYPLNGAHIGAFQRNREGP